MIHFGVSPGQTEVSFDRYPFASRMTDALFRAVIAGGAHSMYMSMNSIMIDDKSKQRSFTFLSLLCFALADVCDGLGPFWGVYLQGKGWTADAIGFVMTAGGLAELLCITPLGALSDHTRHKRGLIALSVVLIVLGCGIIFLWSDAVAATLSKILQGVAAAAVKPALTGLTLGMTGQKGLAARLGVNEAWSHAGNATTAVLSGLVGYMYGIPGVFFVMAVMGCMALFTLLYIDPAHIDYAVARGMTSDAGRQAPKLTRDVRLLFMDKPLLVIGVTLFFFILVMQRCSPCWGSQRLPGLRSTPQPILPVQ